MNPVLSEILDHLSAVEIIGEHVALRQTGKTWKGLCPFHPEKTPSFHVNPERGLWHCFGCGAGGDLISFVMKIQNLPFPEAKDFLAQKAGIPLAKFDSQNPKRKRLFDILELSTEFYRGMLLKSAPGEQGLDYLTSRRIEADMIEKFQIGMAPSSSHGLLGYLTARNYSVDELREVGLVTRTEPPRDYFFKRIIFPIWDSTGRTIGFGGRALGEEQPKYLNSAETALFKKGENLYAFHFAKSEIGKQRVALLAEGYLDVIALHQHGFSHSAATLGTSLTPNQAKLLARFAPKVLLGYDGDRAGAEAMRRAMTVMQGSGLELEFIAFPPGEDPDSFLRKNGAAAFGLLMKQSLTPIDFVFEQMKLKLDLNTPEGKKKVIEETSPFLKSTVDPVLKDAYVKKLAQSLNLSESVVRKATTSRPEQSRIEIQTKPSRERDLLSWLLWEPSLAGMVWSALSPEEFEDPQCQEAARVLHRLWQEGKQSLSEIEQIPETALLLLSRLSAQPPPGNLEAVEALIGAQKNQKTKRELRALKQEVLSRLKEGKVKPTDEAYQKYLSLLRGAKGTREHA